MTSPVDDSCPCPLHEQHGECDWYCDCYDLEHWHEAKQAEYDSQWPAPIDESFDQHELDV